MGRSKGMGRQGICFIERSSWTAHNTLAEFSHTQFDPSVCRGASCLSLSKTSSQHR
jgi:hypothetical protein